LDNYFKKVIFIKICQTSRIFSCGNYLISINFLKVLLERALGQIFLSSYMIYPLPSMINLSFKTLNNFKKKH
jgi:hypothetical protein